MARGPVGRPRLCDRPVAHPGYAAPAAPGLQDDKSIEGIRTELNGLYREAEIATEAYNTADVKAAGQTKRLAALRKDLARSEGRVRDLRNLAGAAARTQYRGGDLASTGIQLLLGDHPDQALDEASQARQALRSLATVSDSQKSARDKVSRQTDAAAKKLRELKISRSAKAAAKQRIEQKIARAEQIEDGLQRDQARRLAQLDNAAEQKAKSRWTGGDSGSDTKATGAAERAVDFAMAQMGKPYVWGRSVLRRTTARGSRPPRGRRPDTPSPYLAGAMARATACQPDVGATRGPDHLLQRRHPRRHVHRPGADRARTEAGTFGHGGAGRLDAHPRRGPTRSLNR